MRIKKKIFAMLMMLCMVLQMLPNTVLAETISGEGNTYIGPTRICPNSDLEFYFTTDNVGQDGRDAWIGGIDKIDETYLSVYSKGDTWSAVISKNGIQKAYSQSSSFSICISSNMVSTLRELNITINISHIDDNFDHKCDDCGEKISDHIDNNRDHYCDTCKVRVSCSGGTATCKDKAICEICEKPYGEKDPTNHVGGKEIRDSKAATCTEDGYTGDTYCKGCNTKLSSGEPIAASGHKDDNKDHSCDVCGAEVGEHIDADHDHKCDYGCAVAIGDHKAGEGKHTCDYCGAVMSKCSGGTATCKDKAICEICGKPYGEKDPTNHVGGTEIRDSKAATCTENGYEGDSYCKDCGVKLSSGEPIVAFGHTYKDEVTKEATTESAGIRTYTCEKCGDSYTEEIAKLPAKPEPTKPSKPENRVEPTKPSKSENRVEPSKPTEPQKQIEPPKTVNQISLIEILIAMFVNGIAVPSMQLITSIWQLILQFIKMLLTAAF